MTVLAALVLAAVVVAPLYLACAAARFTRRTDGWADARLAQVLDPPPMLPVADAYVLDAEFAAWERELRQTP